MFGNFGYSYDSEFRGDRRTTLAEARDTPHATAPVVFVDMISSAVGVPNAARSPDERAPLLQRVDPSNNVGYFSRGFVARLVLGALALTAVSAASFGTASASTGLLGIDWAYVNGPGQDPIMTTDSGELQGTCDIDTCFQGNHEIGEYAYVDNCLDGGAGCMEDSRTTGCRICTINTPGYPTWFPLCPDCVCTTFGVTTNGTICEPTPARRRARRNANREAREEAEEAASEPDEASELTPSATPAATASPAA